MKKLLLLIMIMGLSLSACGGASSSGSSDVVNDDDDNDNNGGATEELETAFVGDQGIFVSYSSSDSDTMTLGGQTVTITSGSQYIYRYIPENPSLEKLDNTYNATNNYSCDSAGAQKPYITGQSLFNIEVCPNIDSGYSTIDVEQIDAETGEALTSACNLYALGTSQVSINVFVIDGTLYYVNSDGALVTLSPSACSSKTILLGEDHADNSGDFFGIDGSLISVKDDIFYNDQYIVRQHNLSTGAVTSQLYLINVADDDDSYTFFEGDDGLYWSVYNTTSKALSIYRYPLTGTPTQIYSTTLSDSLIGGSPAVDASGGKVFFAYEYVASRNESGYATSWTIVGKVYDVSEGTTSDLSIGSVFKSTMQYMIYE